MAKEFIPKQKDSFSDWYNALVLRAELADYAPVKGCMVIRPYGYALWEAIQRQFDSQIQKKGVRNAYFPLFIPESFIKREKEHVEGFSPELAVVTHGGGEKLEEPLIVRPTSETIINEMYSRWIHSWRDLPLLINQWCNIVRWEKRTYLFLRTTEFLWQEGHTVHATHKEAYEMMLWALEQYRILYEDFLAIPVAVGKKTRSETFAGALETQTTVLLLPAGKALQGATSHDLGQNFSKPFKIQFQDKNGQLQYGWQTSWGLSTRSIGGIIMAHGDDNGLRLPPKVAPIQVVIIPLSDKKEILGYSEKVAAALSAGSRTKCGMTDSGIRVEIDRRFNQTAGWKFNDWELKGVPLRIEIGEREVKEKGVTLYRRDILQKEFIPLSPPSLLGPLVSKKLEEIQKTLFNQAKAFQEKNTVAAGDFASLQKAVVEGKFATGLWCGSSACEAQIKEKTKATIRVVLEEKVKGKCLLCSQPASTTVLFAKSY